MVFNPSGAMCMTIFKFGEQGTHSIFVVFVFLVSMCTEIKLQQFCINLY